MALVQHPIDVPFAGPAEATFTSGRSLLDLLVQNPRPVVQAMPSTRRTLVPYFGSSEPLPEASVGKPTSLDHLEKPKPTRCRKIRTEPTSPVRSANTSRAVRPRPSTGTKPANKVWAACMTSPNPEDVPLPSKALLGRVRSAAL